MKRRYIVLALLLLIIALTACDSTTRGSGNVITEERDVSGYDSIALTGIGSVEIIQGDTESVVVEAEDNIMPLLTAEVQDGTLILSQEDNRIINPTKPIKYTVQIIEVNGLSTTGSGDIKVAILETNTLNLDLSGSGSINVISMDADSLTVNISGSGQVELSGQINDQQLDISGSGEYQASDLASKTANINVSGSGKAVVAVEDTLDATISGSGLVSYYGDPVVTSSLSGSGAIEQLEEE
jgi:predicted small secreted protein